MFVWALRTEAPSAASGRVLQPGFVFVGLVAGGVSDVLEPDETDDDRCRRSDDDRHPQEEQRRLGHGELWDAPLRYGDDTDESSEESEVAADHEGAV